MAVLIHAARYRWEVYVEEIGTLISNDQSGDTVVITWNIKVVVLFLLVSSINTC